MSQNQCRLSRDPSYLLGEVLSMGPVVRLLGGDGKPPVDIPAYSILVTSPLVKSIILTICPCLADMTTIISFPWATTATLQLLAKYLMNGMVVGEWLAVQKLSAMLELLSPGLTKDTVVQRSATGQRQKKPSLQKLPRFNRPGMRVKQTVIVAKENIPDQKMSVAAWLPASKQKNQKAIPVPVLPHQQELNGNLGGEDITESGFLLDLSVAHCGIVEPKMSRMERQHFQPRLLKEEEEEIGTMCQCKLCLKLFTSAATLVSHLVVHYPQEQIKLPCAYCKFTATEANLIRHLQAKHTLEESYTCSLCPTKFNTFSAQRMHMQKHSRPDMFTQCTNYHFYMDDSKPCPRCSKKKKNGK